MYSLWIKISTIEGWDGSTGLFNGLLKIETNELIVGIILILLGGVSQTREGESVMMLLVVSGMWMTVISKDWISIILSIEVQSYGIYLIVCKKSIGSGLRYNIIGGISSNIIIISILNIYSECGLTNIAEIKIIGDMYGGYGGYGGYGVIIGILTKMGTAPMHNWISDIIENISADDNKWVAGISKLPLIKIINEWGQGQELVIIILTLGIGAILGSTAYRIRKFIAFSGIHNLGYLLIIVSNNEKWLFVTTQYVITLISILMIYRGDVSIWSICKQNPWVGVAITISMLSSIGIPPLIGFYAKLSIMEWGLENGWGIITIIVITGSVASGRNYIRIVRNTWSSNTGTGSLTSGIYLSVVVSLMLSNIVERYTHCI